MRIAFYFISITLFILSAGMLAFSPITRENLELVDTLIKTGVVVLLVNSGIDLIKYLLRMGEYSSPRRP